MIERRDYQLKVISPLHIGSGETLLQATDFVILDQRVFVFDQPSFLQELSRRGIITSYAKELGNRRRTFNLGDFLRKHNLLKEDFLKTVSRYQIPARGSPREIRAFIKTLGRPFVPGSSVKGALRVGMLYRLLKELGEPFLKEYVWKGIEEEIGQLSRLSGQDRRKKRNQLRRKLGQFVDDLLRLFRLKGDSRDPRTDLLRCVKVCDSSPLDPSRLAVTKVQVSKLKGESSTSLWVEALIPKTAFRIIIEVDHDLLQFFARENTKVKLPVRDVEVPFELYQRFFSEPFSPAVSLVKDLIEEEKVRLPESWLRFTEPVNFRLGWGQGLLSAALFLLLPQDLRKRLRNELFKDEGAAEAPLTRKVSNSGLMGFCQVGFIKRRHE